MRVTVSASLWLITVLCQLLCRGREFRVFRAQRVYCTDRYVFRASEWTDVTDCCTPTAVELAGVRGALMYVCMYVCMYVSTYRQKNNGALIIARA